MVPDLNGKRITIIGGAGFIGHNMARYMVNHGAHVEIIDSLQVNNLGAFTDHNSAPLNRKFYTRVIRERLDMLARLEVPLHIVDARDYHLLQPRIAASKPDVVVHLAAVAHANRANKDPYHTFDHSLRTLENALDSCRDLGAQFIYFSSSMVYGNFDADRVTEESNCDPIGIYGALKFSGEKMVNAYRQVFGLDYTIIRPSALYGPGCVSRRVGQVFIENAISGHPVKIYGDGSDALDFTYIDDLVRGICLSIGNEKAYGEIFNLTCGNGRTINELAAIIGQYFPNIAISNVERSALMPERGTLSVNKAKELLGYEAEFQLEQGMQRYVQWYKDFATVENDQLV